MNQQQRPLWVLFVTDGMVLEFAPELYSDPQLGLLEAERWALYLSFDVATDVRRPFEGRWEVGHRDIRLVRTVTDWREPTPEWWIGTHWTRFGYPDPEAWLFPNRAEASAWATQDLNGERPHGVVIGEDEVSALFFEGDKEERSSVTRAKVVTSGLV
ncbi:MAG TPA: hypothetical protein VIY86_10905 [Pirellulaceae bacterium]